MLNVIYAVFYFLFRSESSIRSYSGRLTTERKRIISETLTNTATHAKQAKPTCAAQSSGVAHQGNSLVPMPSTMASIPQVSSQLGNCLVPLPQPRALSSIPQVTNQQGNCLVPMASPTTISSMTQVNNQHGNYLMPVAQHGSVASVSSSTSTGTSKQAPQNVAPSFHNCTNCTITINVNK